MNKPVLFCYDGSDGSRAALAAAGELIKPADAVVLVVWMQAAVQLARAGSFVVAVPNEGEIDEQEAATACELDHPEYPNVVGAGERHKGGLTAARRLPAQQDAPDACMRTAEPFIARTQRGSVLGGPAAGAVRRLSGRPGAVPATRPR